MIDTNVSLFRWPFRRLPHDEPARLASKLRASGVTQTWAGSFEGLLHRDIAGVNLRLAEACRQEGLVPFGSVNPTLPGWEDDLRRCSEDLKMPGIRLHPCYHGYALTDERLLSLLQLAAKRRLIVQVALAMEDERTQHPLLRVPALEPEPLIEVVRKCPDLRLVLLNRSWGNDWPLVRRLRASGQIYFECAMLEGLGAVSTLVREAGPDRVLFGSHFPFYYLESAQLKIREAGLSPSDQQSVLETNALHLLH